MGKMELTTQEIILLPSFLDMAVDRLRKDSQNILLSQANREAAGRLADVAQSIRFKVETLLDEVSERMDRDGSGTGDQGDRQGSL